MAADKKTKDVAPTRADAEKRVAEAEQALAEARDKLAEEQGDLRAVVSRDVPQFVVEVAPNAVVGHEGKMYHGVEYGVIEGADGRLTHGEDHGTELTLDGPTAIALTMSGQVKILRSA